MHFWVKGLRMPIKQQLKLFTPKSFSEATEMATTIEAAGCLDEVEANPFSKPLAKDPSLDMVGTKMLADKAMGLTDIHHDSWQEVRNKQPSKGESHEPSEDP